MATFTASPTYIPLVVLPCLIVFGFVLKRVYYELTTGSRRRAMIRENGCKPVVWHDHQGVLGKLIGLDTIKALLESSERGAMCQDSRIRNFTGRNTVQFRILREVFITTIEPENVKTILSTKFTDYSLGKRRRDTFIPVLGHGIFDTDGPAWERSRALIRPNFTRQQVADLDTFETHIQHMINNIPIDCSTVDLQDLFFSLTMDSATEFLFGRSTNILDPANEMKYARDFVEAFVYVTHEMPKDSKTGGLNKFIPNARFRRSVKTIHTFADEVVRDAIARHRSNDLEKNSLEKKSLQRPDASQKERYVFLHELLKQTQDPYTLRSELLNVLLAGRDTTAGLLSNTWHVLARRPDIWAKLRTEVDALAGKAPTYSEIKDMKYLKYVLNESLRLMPVVPGNNRTAVRDTILPLGGGPEGKSPVFVPAGQTVGYSPWSMHRREDFYGPDALEFKPERWATLRPGWEYLPFNGGPRICIGQQFALLEASYATIRLMQRFEKVEPRDDRPWKEWMTLTLASGTGCLVGLIEK